MLSVKWCDLYCSIGIVLSCVVICAHSDVPRPRGVSLAKASLYSPSKDFTCLDGTVTIPFSFVNDDYCDCFDGSDEPGTSACLNGIFHCTNAGHQAQNIPSSRVNDGVCDCCDGTDEYSNPNACPNTCELLGKEAEAEAQRLTDLLKAGSIIRQELIELGSKTRIDMAQQISFLEQDKAEAEKIKQEKETIKDQLEAKENEALSSYRALEEEARRKEAEQNEQADREKAVSQFERFDSNSDGYLTIDELKTRNELDKDRDGEVSDEEVKYFLAEMESIDLENFVTQTWPLMKPYIMMQEGMFKPPSEDDEENVADEGNNESEEVELEDLETETDDDMKHGDHEEEEEFDKEDHEHEPDSNKYNEETQKLVQAASEARREFTEAERNVREIDSKIRTLKENLQKDYGFHTEFAALDGQCFEFEDKEYVYKLCLFQKVTQKAKDSSSEVGLGNWGEWAGEGGNPYSVMKYTNGIACWNGPSRATTVMVRCGLDNKLLSVTEPYRCEYKAEFTTPAACDPSYLSQQAVHDEL